MASNQAGIGTRLIEGISARLYALQQGDGNTLTLTQSPGIRGMAGGYVANSASVSQMGNNTASTISMIGGTNP